MDYQAAPEEKMAEGEGFEPRDRFLHRLISSQVPSTGLSHPSARFLRFLVLALVR